MAFAPLVFRVIIPELSVDQVYVALLSDVVDVIVPPFTLYFIFILYACHTAYKVTVPPFVAVKLEKNAHKGIPDYMFIAEGGTTMFVEFKRPDGKGVASDEQKYWAEFLGYSHRFIDNFEDFKKRLDVFFVLGEADVVCSCYLCGKSIEQPEEQLDMYGEIVCQSCWDYEMYQAFQNGGGM